MIDLPIFPTFRPIELKDRDWYNEYAKNLNPYADFNFNTLVVWFNKTHQLELSNCNGNVAIRYPDILHDTVNTIYTLYGNQDIDASLVMYSEYFRTNNIEQKLEMIPEDVTNNISDSNKFSFVEDIDNSEYILDCTSIAELPGKEYRRLREDRNSFQNSYGDKTVVREVDLSSQENKTMIYDQYITWLQNGYQRSNDPEHNEKGVIESILANSEYLEYHCLGTFVEDKLASFVLYYFPAQPSFAMPSVIKSNYFYEDIFDFMVNAFAKHVDNDVEFINFEQDLGIKGLREYKSSLKPKYFLKKHILTITR